MSTPLLIMQFQRNRVDGLIAELRNGKGWRFSESFLVGSPTETGEKVPTGNQLREYLYTRFPRRMPKCIVVLHQHDVVLTSVVLPEGTDAEISDMINLDMVDSLPLGIENTCYGWQRNSYDSTKIDVYWTPLRIIDDILAILAVAQIDAAAFIPSLACYKMLLPEEQKEGLLLLNQAHNSAEIFAFAPNGGTLFARGRYGEITSGSMRQFIGSSLTECAKSLGTDTNTSLQFHVYPPNTPLSCEVKGISLSPLPDVFFDDLLKSFVEPLEDASPPPLALMTAARTQIDSRVSPGSLLVPSLDMLPRAICEARERRIHFRLLSQSAILGASILLLVLANIWLYTRKTDSQLTSVKADIASLAPAAREIEAMKERIRSIREQIDYVLSPIDALREINRIFAGNAGDLDGLFLDYLEYKEPGLITMEGHSTNDITPWRFAEAISKTGRFVINKSPRIQIRSYGETRAIRFDLGIRATGISEVLPSERPKDKSSVSETETKDAS